jgi:hypothetical protein
MNKREIISDGDKAYVPLTKGFVAVIDAADVHLVNGFNWTAMVRPRTVYAKRHVRTGDGTRTTILLHRVIAATPDGMQTDHRDGNGLNNTRDNLRNATHAENQRNQRLSIASTSGFKGVHWHKREKAWTAQIKCGGKAHNLGSFASAEAAAAAYAEASAALHGEFGRAWAAPERATAGRHFGRRDMKPIDEIRALKTVADCHEWRKRQGELDSMTHLALLVRIDALRKPEVGQ